MSKRTLGIRVDQETYTALRHEAERLKLSPSELGRRILTGALADEVRLSPASPVLFRLLEVSLFSSYALRECLRTRAPLGDELKGRARREAEAMLGPHAARGNPKKGLGPMPSPERMPNAPAPGPTKPAPSPRETDERDLELARRLTSAGRSS